MKKRFVGFLLAALLAFPAHEPAAAVTVPDPSPRVAELIQGTFLEHGSHFPRDNEPEEVIRAVLQHKGSPMELEIFAQLASAYPDSRHARLGYANALQREYRSSQDPSDLKKALHEAIAASRIEFANGSTQYLQMIRSLAMEANHPKLASQWFEQILLEIPDNYLVHLEYGKLLANLNDSKAEHHFQKAMDHRPLGTIDSYVSYTEYLLDHGRYEEALQSSVLVGETALYLDFLHGVALEKLGQGEQAKNYYDKYSDMSTRYPAPQRFHIKNSPYQEKVHFEGGTLEGIIQPEVSPGSTNLSYTIACEATGESAGAMRAVGYTVRQRVLRGKVTTADGTVCVSPSNTGTTLDQKYANVICQATAYAVSCDRYTNVISCDNGNKPTSDSAAAADGVYYGYVADPYTGYCPAGGSTSDVCSSRCSSSANTGSYTNRTPHSFRLNQSTFYPCMKSAGKLCGNGGNDNYFFYND